MLRPSLFSRLSRLVVIKVASDNFSLLCDSKFVFSLKFQIMMTSNSKKKIIKKTNLFRNTELLTDCFQWKEYRSSCNKWADKNQRKEITFYALKWTFLFWIWDTRFLCACWPMVISTVCFYVIAFNVIFPSLQVLLSCRSSIHYREGKARLYIADADGFMELLPGSENDSSPIRRVLQTKWPGLGIEWKDSVAPAIWWAGR